MVNMKSGTACILCLIALLILLSCCNTTGNNQGIVYDVVISDTALITESSDTVEISVPSFSSAPLHSSDAVQTPASVKTPAPAHSALPSPEATARQTSVPASPPSTLETDKYKYEIHINRIQNCITVYKLDKEGKYSIPYKAFICSTGDATPLGTFRTTDKYVWRALFGDVFGQYATRITGRILFHSVPYKTQHKNDLEYEEYNKLGTAASMGCIRLTCADAKWIYDNCKKGTTVVIYDDESCPGELGKPEFVHINPDDERRCWDPTDPDPDNPWREGY